MKRRSREIRMKKVTEIEIERLPGTLKSPIHKRWQTVRQKEVTGIQESWDSLNPLIVRLEIGRILVERVFLVTDESIHAAQLNSNIRRFRSLSDTCLKRMPLFQWRCQFTEGAISLE